MRAASGTMKSAVLQACNTEEGLTLREIAEKIGRTVKQVAAIIKPMIDHSDLHRAGIRPWCRYFTKPEHAQAFDLRAPALVAQHRAEQKEKNLAAAREYWHRTHGKKKAGAAPNPKAKPKNTEPRKPKHGPTIRLSRKDASVTSISPQAAVTWPDHVQVQHIPHGVDDRFTFTPPPGWKGEITRDWMDRRLAEMSN